MLDALHFIGTPPLCRSPLLPTAYSLLPKIYLPARDLRYFSLSQLAMNALAFSPRVERV